MSSIIKAIRFLDYKRPSSKILEIDMESYYDWLKQNPEEEIDCDAVEWPINFLRYSAFEEGFSEVVFGLEDLEGAKQFRETIKMHANALSEARMKLREFLLANFKLDEVLYISKAMTRDWL